MYKEHYKEFEDMYLKLANVYSKYQVFYDFLKMSAIAIYNSFAKNEEMERDYLQTINKYKKEEQQLFSKMLGELIMMYQDAEDIKDILGPFYEREHLRDNHAGQFFTPTNISNFMAKVIVADKEEIDNYLKENGFISMCEPSCRRRRDGFSIC